MKLTYLLLLLIFAVVPQISSFAQETSDAPIEEPQNGEQTKKKKSRKKKTRKAPKSEVSNQTPSTSETDSTDDGGEPPSDIPNKLLITTPTPSISSFPGHKLGLGLDATPNIYFDSSAATAQLGLGLGNYKTKTTSSTNKTDAKVDIGDITIAYGALFSSKKLFLKVMADIYRVVVRGERTTSSSTQKLSIYSTIDHVEPGAALAFEASNGFWVGAGVNWGINFEKSKYTGSSTSEETSRRDGGSQTISLEYRNPKAHAGFNYKLENSESETTTWTFPMRILLTDKIFMGGSISTETSKDFILPTTNTEVDYESGLGFQGDSSVVEFKYLYYLKRSALSPGGSDPLVSNEKTKGIQIGAVFGPKKGLQFRIDLAYRLTKEVKSDGEEINSTLLPVAFGVASVQ